MKTTDCYKKIDKVNKPHSKEHYQFWDAIKRVNTKTANSIKLSSLKDSNLELGSRIEIRVGLGTHSAPFVEYRGRVIYLTKDLVKIEYKCEDDFGYSYTASCDAGISSLIQGYIISKGIVPFKRISILTEDGRKTTPLKISGQIVRPFVIRNFEKINFLKSNLVKGSIVRVTKEGREVIGTPDNIFEDGFSIYSSPLNPNSDLLCRISRDKYFLGDYRIEVKTENEFKDIIFFD